MICPVPSVAVLFLVASSAVGLAGSADDQGMAALGQSALRLACDPLSGIQLEDSRGIEAGNGMGVLSTVLAKHQLKVRFTELPRRRGIAGARSGRYDGLCSCLSSEDLGGSFYYSEPLGKASIGAVSNSAGDSRLMLGFSGKSNGQALTWGLVEGDGLQGVLRGKGIQNYTFLESYAQGFQMLELGRIDVLLAHKSIALAHARSSPSYSGYNYRELMRPSFHLCLTGVRGKRIIETLNVTLKRFTRGEPMKEALLK